MKKGSLILITVLMVAILFVAFSAVSAGSHNSGAIHCDLNIDYTGLFWEGTVSGDDCAVAGAIRFDSIDHEYRFRPNPENLKTMHFVEQFTIWPGSDVLGGDEWITGKNCGLWNFSTFKYRAHGWVMDASEEWADLVGSQYQEMGVTGDPDAGLPIPAPDGRMHINAGNRPVDAPEGLCAPPEPES
jgi:hypothetical protein